MTTKYYEIEHYIINEYTFERMNDINKRSYSTFLQWNVDCINDLSDKDIEWLNELCKRIGDKKIKLMDEESCAVFEAYKIYFDENKKLCIVNPR